MNLYTETDKSKGGFAFYVHNCLKFSVENMSVVINNLLECLTIQVELDKGKNTFISCIYRAPGSCIDLFFSGRMVEMFAEKTNKPIFICGDLNIDLLNQDKHNMTAHFVNTIYSMNLHPNITRTSRITAQSAT